MTFIGANLDTILRILDVLVFPALLGASGFVYAMLLRLRRLELRVGEIESSVASAPSRDEFHQLNISITEMRRDIEHLSSQFEAQGKVMDGLSKGIGRLNDYLLNKKD